MFREALGRPDGAGAIGRGGSVALEGGFRAPGLGGTKSTEEVTEAVVRWATAGEGVT